MHQRHTAAIRRARKLAHDESTLRDVDLFWFVRRPHAANELDELNGGRQIKMERLQMKKKTHKVVIILVTLVIIVVGLVGCAQCSHVLNAQEQEKGKPQGKLQKRNVLYGAIGRDLFFRFFFSPSLVPAPRHYAMVFVTFMVCTLTDSVIPGFYFYVVVFSAVFAKLSHCL